ncbi:MAG: hypothetical protein ACREIQ_06085 [Nitrospiria bacterium]
MRTNQLLLGGGLLILVLLPVALALGFDPPDSFWATEDVASTKHNLAVNQDIQLSSTTGAEICVFCHTPHGANPDAPGAAPLWNRALPTGSSFTPYTSPNFDAEGDTPGTPKGVSLACLSCHDGTIAFDALINAPGSGGFQPANRGTVTNQGTSVFGASAFLGPIVDTTNSFTEGNRPEGPPNSTDSSPYTGGLDDFVAPDGAAFNSTGSEPFPNLTQNLSDDHPISMAIPSDDPQFDQVITGAVLAGSIWELKRSGGTGGSAINQDISVDKRDVVRAYPLPGTSASGGINSNNGYVECASCHNPHTPRPLFLRIPSVDTAKQTIPPVSIDGRGVVLNDVNTLDQYPNTGSLLCLTCHQK